MFKQKRSLPQLSWYEHHRSPVSSWSLSFHGYVCEVRIVQTRKGARYDAEILCVDKDGRIGAADSKRFAAPESAQEWCKTKLFTNKYMHRRQTLAWRELKKGTRWNATYHGYVCNIYMHQRNSHSEYWPSISYLETSSHESQGRSSEPFYTLLGAQIWCTDYLVGQDLPIKFPKLLVPHFSWLWFGTGTLFVLLVVIAL